MAHCIAVRGPAFHSLAQERPLHCSALGGRARLQPYRSRAGTSRARSAGVAAVAAADSFPEWIPSEANEIEEPACISMLNAYKKVSVSVASMLEPVPTAAIVSKGGEETGLPVILLAGFDSSALEWRRLFPKLCSAEGIILNNPFDRGGSPLECHALDLIGWGFTGFVGAGKDESTNAYSPEGKAMHLKSYIDTYLTKPPVLVGASLGGATCLHFAKMYPESVGGLVLIDAQADPEPLQQMPGFLSELGTSVLKSWPLRSLANNLSYFDKKKFATDDAIRVGRLHTFLSGWKYTILKFMESGGYTPVGLENDIPSTIPVLSIFGEDDKILPRETFEKLSQLSRARAVFRQVQLPQCGHVPHLEQADATATAIREFVMEISSTAPAPDVARA